MSEHYLIFTAPIEQASMNGLVQHLIDLQLSGGTSLTIGISSQGGNVVCGITMYNAIRASPLHVRIHNIGNIDSIANAVFLAGEERFANESATFMFHGVGFEGNPNERLEEKNLMEKLDVVHAEHTRISQIIATRSGLDVAVCLELFKEQKTRDANWAAANGMVHSVTDFKIPAGASIRYLV